MKTLTLQPMTASAFAPYGWLIDANAATGVAINGGSSMRVDGLGELSLDADGGKACLAIFKATAQDPAGPWTALERHRLGTQTFIPLNGARYVVLVALGDSAKLGKTELGKAQLDVSTLRAFAVGSHQGITLRPGTWHHSLLALDDGDFVVIERHAATVDCDIVELAEPVSIACA